MENTPNNNQNVNKSKINKQIEPMNRDKEDESDNENSYFEDVQVNVDLEYEKDSSIKRSKKSNNHLCKLLYLNFFFYYFRRSN